MLDIGVLDVNLAGHEVYPVADVLAARRIPFIFVTCYGESALRAPYDDRPTLAKPFRRDEISDILAVVSGRESPAR